MSKRTEWTYGGPATVPAQPGDWHLVEDATGQTDPVLVRVGRAADGRTIITGLVLEGDELTSSGLRLVRLGDVVRAIADHDERIAAWRAGDAPAPPEVGEVGPTGLTRFEGMAHPATPTEATTTGESVRGRRGPTPEQYQRFADVYAQQSAYPDRIARTMHVLASEHPMGRAKAHRMLNECRTRGLLPQKGTDR